MMAEGRPLFGWLAHKLGLRGCPQCETLVDYALDGLPADQQEGVRRHLDDCPPCREQVRDYIQVGEGLALCSQQVDAPPELCNKVLARLKQDAPPPPSAFVAGGPQGWARFWMLTGPVFALMSVVMTLVAAAALLGRRPPAGPANPLAAASQAVLSDPKASHVSLSGPASGAGAELVICHGMDHAVLTCRDLPASAPGQSYALWLQLGGQAPQRLARFVAAGSGPGDGCHLLSLGAAFLGQGPATFLVKPEGGSAGDGAVLKGSVRL
jgi:hypothetical protein